MLSNEGEVYDHGGGGLDAKLCPTLATSWTITS